MDKKYTSLFEDEQGNLLYLSALSAIKEFGMEEKIKNGVLVGLSGGADSVFLLLFLLEYRRRAEDFKILAVHINHSIRGDAADADECFSRELCRALSVEYTARKIDVPTLAKAQGISLEECARNVRYQEFSDIIMSRNDISSISVAHNADDNLETVLLNIFRGAGTRGASGIPPVRDNIIRPLIYLKKSDILSYLEFSKIKFVTDETNAETEYKRNKVRHNIIPELYSICDDPVFMATRLSHNLRLDDEFINSEADKILGDNNTVSAKQLVMLHKALQVRILQKMAKNADAEISGVIIDAICALLHKGDFSYSLPDGAKFISERDACRIVTDDIYCSDFSFKLEKGKNSFRDFVSDFFLTDDKLDISSLNVYKISIQADISSAIINGSLYLRSRKNGDTVFYGGMTRKVKKLFSDLKIPKSHRDLIPILCDDSGVVWIPGFGVRDDGARGKKIYATLAIGNDGILLDKRFHSASEYR